MFENNDLILIVTYIATGWPKKMPHFIWKKLEAFRIQKLLICKVSKFDGRFLGHPVAIYVTIRIRSLFSNILNHLKQLLWESLSSFSEIPIFPKKNPTLGNQKVKHFVFGNYTSVWHQTMATRSTYGGWSFKSNWKCLTFWVPKSGTFLGGHPVDSLGKWSTNQLQYRHSRH